MGDKKRILFFGDSNTWGYIPASNHERFPESIRFPKVTQSILGDSFEVIEEGLNSRTLVSDDERPGKEGRNGKDYLIPCLDSHDPLDLVVLMLGTNELKHRFGNTTKQIGELFEKHFVKTVLSRKSQFRNSYPKVIIISLPIIDENIQYAKERYIGGTHNSTELKDIYWKIAQENGCGFIDSTGLKVGADGVHLTKESHIKLGKMVAEAIKTLKL